MKYITATDFYNYTQCKYLVYLNKFGDKTLQDSVSDFVKMLWEKGIQHEKTIIFKMAELENKSIFEVDNKKPANQETYKETMKLMNKGVDYIYQGVLINDNYIGRPDLLKKVDGDSSLGSYNYIPIDIKAGRGYEGEDEHSGKIKKSYSLQLTFYALLLGKIQNLTPTKGNIINIDGQYIDYELDIDNKEFTKILDDIKQISLKNELYEPVIGGKCGLCQWKSFCKKWAKENDDLSLLFNLGEYKYGMQEYGINKVSEILDTSLEDWLDKLPEIKKGGYFKGIAEKRLTDYYKRALVFKKNKEIIYNKIVFPKGSKEIHFDIEDDPTQDIVYLYGFWIRENDKEYYKYILAKTIDDEKKATEELWEFLESNKDIPIYHYAPHEKSTLRRLQKKYKLNPEILNSFNKNAIDMYSIIKKNTDFPISSYGLKPICKYLGFNWSAEDAGGANSIEWYSRYLNGNKDIMNKILKYNKEDCKATAFLKDYLEDAK